MNNTTIGEIVDKVVELSVERIEDINNLFKVEDCLCFNLEELFSRHKTGEITTWNLYCILSEQKMQSFIKNSK